MEWCSVRYNLHMKPLPPPGVPGKTEFERFDNAVRQVLTVSKTELLRRKRRRKNERGERAPEEVGSALLRLAQQQMIFSSLLLLLRH